MTVLKSGLLVGLFAGAMFAQDVFVQSQPTPAQPGTGYLGKEAVKRAIKRFTDANGWKESKGWQNAFVTLTPPRELVMLSPVCAVPLLEAPIPKDTNFTARKVRPAERVEPMPEATLPAPACPKE